VSFSLLQLLRPASYTCSAMTSPAPAYGRSVLALLTAAALVTVFLVPADATAQRKKIVFGTEEEGSVVEGYVHKPEVGYIIARQDQEDLETLQLKESFAPKIVRSVDKTPF